MRARVSRARCSVSKSVSLTEYSGALIQNSRLANRSRAEQSSDWKRRARSSSSNSLMSNHLQRSLESMEASARVNAESATSNRPSMCAAYPASAAHHAAVAWHVEPGKLQSVSRSASLDQVAHQLSRQPGIARKRPRCAVEGADQLVSPVPDRRWFNAGPFVLPPHHRASSNTGRLERHTGHARSRRSADGCGGRPRKRVARRPRGERPGSSRWPVGDSQLTCAGRGIANANEAASAARGNRGDTRPPSIGRQRFVCAGGAAAKLMVRHRLATESHFAPLRPLRACSPFASGGDNP